jgi:hypothetical protein
MNSCSEDGAWVSHVDHDDVILTRKCFSKYFEYFPDKFVLHTFPYDLMKNYYLKIVWGFCKIHKVMPYKIDMPIVE